MNNTEEKFHERLIKRGWRYIGAKLGVRIYTSKKPFKPNCDKILIHIGFSKGTHWYNYVLFEGDKRYFNEKLNMFLIDCEMQDAWNRNIEEIINNSQREQ